MFTPKLFQTLRTYTWAQLLKDLLAGVIVGIVALPLAIAFAIASGVSPEKGIYTAIIAGFIISAFGGSRVQIGGPTGAFIVIVYGIVQTNGVNGLIIATFIAGVLLMLMGFARLGSVIKYIPHPLIVGFTTGIAVIIFSSQIKDFLGLQMGAVPADFIGKWESYFQHMQTINWYAAGIAVVTILISIFFPRITRAVPGSLVAIILTTFTVQLLHLPVETIGSRFGHIPSSLPLPVLPPLNMHTIRDAIQPAIAIALLGGIESLLSAVVADGMIGGHHKSNMELVAQGGANIASALFGGIPATGAIARTATNVKSGGRTPVAGIIHAITLLVILLLVGQWATFIPMSCLSGILVIVAYNMSEYETFFDIARGSRSDAAVLLTTFFLTVLFDLTIAIEVGMVLATFLFMRRMIQISDVNILLKENDKTDDPLAVNKFNIPKGVEVFELNGPLFFGAAYKFKDSIQLIEKKPSVLIVRMRNVPVIDATGLHTIKDVLRTCDRAHIRLIISGLQPEVRESFKKSRLLFRIGKRYVVEDFPAALQVAKQVLEEGW
ncbi:SulP family inorganic anion transporter [Chitinophaga eiseniae]|uniref:Sulfate permease n=1 Tax=Chitinophaga eiseniae TaxID=634771 RepID=A0A847SGN5_9BACT|nr:sulfate permease [Chitinophaga eiseniae]NLR78185.1 sulfate permease [Chitinophaga eiseniae]